MSLLPDKHPEVPCCSKVPPAKSVLFVLFKRRREGGELNRIPFLVFKKKKNYQINSCACGSLPVSPRQAVPSEATLELNVGAEELAQQLRALTALADVGSIPSIHSVAHNCL